MSNLAAQIEAVLFVAGEPVTAQQLAAACGSSVLEVQHELRHLAHTYSGRGLQLTHHADKWQLATAPIAAGAVASFHNLAPSKLDLSRAALEALAVVAYRGPATKSEIETIRGVASDQVLRNLLARGLVVEHGRRNDEAGRPVQYVVSHELLTHWGLSHTGELPALEELREA